MTRHASPPNAPPSREALVRLGREGRPWAFLPAAAAALAAAPEDAGLRFLAAANAARLGLRTIARELLAAIPDAVAHHPDVQALSAALSGLPCDLVTARDRERCHDANRAALAARGVSIADGPLERMEVFRTLDGNVVKRAASSARGDLRAVGPWRNRRTGADEIAATVAGDGTYLAGGVLLDGLESAWVLPALLRATSHTRPRCRISIVIAQAALARLIDEADMREAILDARVEWFVGERGPTALRDALLARLDTVLPERVAVAGEAEASSVRLALAEARAAQDAPPALRTAPRDQAGWRERFAAIANGRPGRVLIPSTRLSTFTRHAADDLADAFERAGWSARIIREPDDLSALHPSAVARAVSAFDPDLIISINVPRSALPGVANVPFVTWVQDARPDLVDGTADVLATPLDFVAGHVFAEWLTPSGALPPRALAAGVPASVRKFAAMAGDADTPACDLLYVSHQSEPPHAMHARLLAEAGDGRLARVFTRLEGDVRAVVHAASRVRPIEALRDACEARVREVFGAGAPVRLVTLALHAYAAPLAERVFRHDMLGWAAAIARARGLRLDLYGDGWERVEGLCEFARGPLPHGPALARVYRGAKVNLHASIHTLAHQRVLECALAGGFSACRFQADACAAPAAAARAALLALPPDVHDGRRAGYVAARHAVPADAGLVADDGGVLWIDEPDAALADASRRSPDQNASLVLGPFNHFTFDSRVALEALVNLPPESRAGRAARQRAGALAHATHDVFMSRVVGLVRGSLGCAAR